MFSKLFCNSLQTRRNTLGIQFPQRLPGDSKMLRLHMFSTASTSLSHRRPSLALPPPPHSHAFPREITVEAKREDEDDTAWMAASALSLLGFFSGEEEDRVVDAGKVGIFLLAGACVAVTTLVVTVAVVAFVWQRRLIYFPSKLIEWTPVDYKLNHTEDLYLEAGDRVKIHCWFIKSKNYQKVPTLLFFHGSCGNISHRLDHVIKLREMDCNIFLVSYRGYGRSEGYPSETGLALDAQAALDYLLKRTDIDTKKIIVFGSSLGGGVGINLVANNPKKVAALILENTFTSIEEITLMKYPFMSALTFLVRDKYYNEDKIKDLELPLMFVSGRADTQTPPAMMDRLFEVANQTQRKHITRIQNGDHNDTWMQPGYATAIMSFVEETLGSLEQSTIPKS